MFRNSIKEVGEPFLEEASLPRRDSLSKLHDLLRSTSVDGHVSWLKANFIQVSYYVHCTSANKHYFHKFQLDNHVHLLKINIDVFFGAPIVKMNSINQDCNIQ